MDPIEAIFSALSADSGLAALLAEFDGSRAIFSGDVLPPEEEFALGALPCILIRPPFGETNRDDFSSFARSVELDVLLYAKAGESSADIDAAAARVRHVLHRQYLAFDAGGPPALCTVSGPFGAPTSDASIAGRRLSARLDLRG